MDVKRRTLEEREPEVRCSMFHVALKSGRISQYDPVPLYLDRVWLDPEDPPAPCRSALAPQFGGTPVLRGFGPVEAERLQHQTRG